MKHTNYLIYDNIKLVMYVTKSNIENKKVGV